MASIHLTIESCSFVSVLWVSWMEAPLAFRAKFLCEPLPSMRVLKLEVLDMGSKSFHPEREKLRVEFLPDCMTL